MRPAIAVYAVVGLLLLFGIDRLWPVWPVHVVAIGAGLVVLALAFLAGVAAGKR